MEETPETQTDTVTHRSSAAGSGMAGGQPFYLFDDIVGESIMEPLTEPPQENSSSMSCYRGTASTYLIVADGDSFEAPDFTSERFIKIDSAPNVYRYWVSHEAPALVSDGWALRSLSISNPATVYKPSGLMLKNIWARSLRA